MCCSRLGVAPSRTPIVDFTSNPKPLLLKDAASAAATPGVEDDGSVAAAADVSDDVATRTEGGGAVNTDSLFRFTEAAVNEEEESDDDVRS
jgi:hypothetical protein